MRLPCLLRNAVFYAALVGIAALTCVQTTDAQTSPLLEWDETAPVTGFAVTVDGVRTDYGLSPLAADGTCGCAVVASFIGARHTVTVSAYNASGETASAPFIVGPTADAGGPYQGVAGSALNVSGAASTDQTSTITTYAWRWGDGTTDTTATTATASHLYSFAGTYTVTLTVTDGDGATHTASTTATIATAATPPSAPASPSPASGATNVNTAVTLTWSATGATNYDVYFGTSNPPPLATSNLTTASYSPPALANSTSYFWQVIARNAQGSTAGSVWTFTTAAPTSSPSPSTITLVQSSGKKTNARTSSTSIAFASATSPRNWIGVVIRADAANAVLTVNDSSGNPYSRAAQSNIATASGSVTLAVFYAENIKGGSDTIRIAQTVPAVLDIAIVEYSGVATASSIDSTTFNQGIGTTPTSGTATTTANRDLLLGIVTTANRATITGGSGFTMVRRVPSSSNGTLMAVEQQIQSAAGAAAATATLGASDNWGAYLVAVKAQ